VANWGYASGSGVGYGVAISQETQFFPDAKARPSRGFPPSVSARIYFPFPKSDTRLYSYSVSSLNRAEKPVRTVVRVSMLRSKDWKALQRQIHLFSDRIDFLCSGNIAINRK